MDRGTCTRQSAALSKLCSSYSGGRQLVNWITAKPCPLFIRNGQLAVRIFEGDGISSSLESQQKPLTFHAWLTVCSPRPQTQSTMFQRPGLQRTAHAWSSCKQYADCTCDCGGLQNWGWKTRVSGVVCNALIWNTEYGRCFVAFKGKILITRRDRHKIRRPVIWKMHCCMGT